MAGPTLGALTTFVATSYATSFAHTAYVQTDSVDIGSAAINLNVTVSIEYIGTGGSANGYVDYYLVESSAAAAGFNANASGTSGAWTASGTTEADVIRGARFIGRLAVNATASAAAGQWQAAWRVHGPFQQHAAIIAYNAMGASATNANSASFIKYQTVSY